MKIGFNGYNAVYNGHFATYGQTPPQPTQNGWYGRTFRSWQDVCTYINVDRHYGIEIPISYTLHTTDMGQGYLIDADNLNVGSAQIFDENVAFFVGPYNIEIPHVHDGQMYTMYIGKIPVMEDLFNNGLEPTAVSTTASDSTIGTRFAISSYSSFYPQHKNILVDINNNWRDTFMTAMDISANMYEYYPYKQYDPTNTCDYTSARFGNISANYEGTVIYGEQNGCHIRITTQDSDFANQCDNKTISSTIMVANIVGESLQPHQTQPFNAIFNASVYPSAQGDTAVFPIV